MNSQGTKEGLNVREVFPLLRYALFPSRSEFGIFNFVPPGRRLKIENANKKNPEHLVNPACPVAPADGTGVQKLLCDLASLFTP